MQTEAWRWQPPGTPEQLQQEQMASGELSLPLLRFGHFDGLPQHLEEFRRQGRGFKYLFRI